MKIVFTWKIILDTFKRLYIIENSVIWHEQFSTPIKDALITSKTKIMIWDKCQESIKKEEKYMKEYKSTSIFVLVLAHS